MFVSYLSYILAILVSPRPLRKLILVVEACASIFPPIGFLGSAWKLRKKIIPFSSSWWQIDLISLKNKIQNVYVRHWCPWVCRHLIGYKNGNIIFWKITYVFNEYNNGDLKHSALFSVCQMYATFRYLLESGQHLR